MSDLPEWSFREELQKLLDDPTTDFTDAVIVLPKEKQITHDSQLVLTAVGILEWCKRSLLSWADDEYFEDEDEPSRTKDLLN